MGKFMDQIEEKFILPDDSLFVGSRTANGSTVLVRNAKGVTELPPCLEIVNHSPTGFEWGYAGSGPAQLAVALLRFVSQSDRIALDLHQLYKRDVVAKLPKNWALHEWQVRAWILDNMDPDRYDAENLSV